LTGTSWPLLPGTDACGAQLVPSKEEK